MGLASRHLWIFSEDRKASAAAASILVSSQKWYATYNNQDYA
jgi:hypothetical protein